MQSNPKVDLCFQVSGKTIPVDHGFALHGAISDVLPDFHEDQTVGLKLIWLFKRTPNGLKDTGG
ncbi:MAG: hypothetical protein JRI72_06290 [Deltaproteobacteria bacterium]|nr:hypothetical protein [Deltaproteobacteria bacterium]